MARVTHQTPAARAPSEPSAPLRSTRSAIRCRDDDVMSSNDEPRPSALLLTAVHYQEQTQCSAGDTVEKAPARGYLGMCGCDMERRAQIMAHETAPRVGESQGFILGFHGVRYQVKDVSRSVAFYTHHLGFKLEHQQLPPFASVSIENLQILLSGPGASGSRALPDGRHQEPGGWNRIVLRVADLPARIDA